MSDQLRGDLLKMMKEKAYRKGEYKLSSGKSSEHYVNCKPVILNGRGLWITSHLLLKTIEHDAKAVAGLTLGADPLVSGVAFASFQFWNNTNPKFMIDGGLIVRKEPKGHGTQAWIEGLLPRERTNITVLEDVITTGGSAIKAVKRLRDAGYVVNRVVSIVDRQEDGEADTAMKLAGLELISIFKLDELTDENE